MRSIFSWCWNLYRIESLRDSNKQEKLSCVYSSFLKCWACNPEPFLTDAMEPGTNLEHLDSSAGSAAGIWLSGHLARARPARMARARGSMDRFFSRKNVQSCPWLVTCCLFVIQVGSCDSVHTIAWRAVIPRNNQQS